MNYGDILADFRQSVSKATQMSVGNRPRWASSNAPRGVGQGSAAPTPNAASTLRARTNGSGNGGNGGGGGAGCGEDPNNVSTRWGGLCVCQPGECEYDPAVFCGWSALPFSTFKNQGPAPLSGPVVASFGGLRTVRITAARACLFRVRGVWFRSFDAADCTTNGVSMLANVTINDTPTVVEIGGLAPTEQIGIPSSLFDNGICFVLPTDWGIISANNNESKPLQLDFMTPCADDQHVVGVLFGDPLRVGGNGSYESQYGNYMLM